jgi:flagellar hook protein FlgE
MGIFGALTTAISGLRAQSYALEQISGNIANSQTTGYKRTETAFADLVPDSPPRRQAAGSVDAFARATNTVQGDVVNSDIETHMAITGDGYFVVEPRSGQADGAPLFSGVDNYTRRGDFELDRNGFLVNGTGYYLKGIGIDPQTGNPNGSLPTIVRVTNDFLPAKATSEINYRANLASFPLTSLADPLVPNSELLNVASFNNDPRASGAGFVRADDVNDLLAQSISGGAVTTFDAAGAPVNVQMRWAKIDSVGNGGSDTWNLFYQEDSTATGTAPAWRNVGTNYVFGSNGQLSPAISTVTVTGLTVNGNNLGNITLDHGANGITQFADPNGVTKVTDLSQNGFAAGELVGVSLGDGGRLAASYTNGQTLAIAEISVVSFNADNALKKLDGGAFAATQDSGTAISGALGTIIGQSLEGSNTDIADEFTKLIVTQQAYSAGTRVITTSDAMLQEALNMIR